MIQIGTREQLTKREAEQVEEEYRQKFKANMNAQKCFITEEQKRERDRENKQEYYLANREKLKEQRQKYRLASQKYKEYEKEYRLSNREKIKEHNSEKIVCECGCEIRRDSLAKHKRTHKHKQIMENK